MKHLFTCLLLLCPLAAAAQSSSSAASVADCERLKNDLAYNQCLASFGPRRGERPARDVDDDEPPALRAAGRGSRVKGRGGRQAASFDVVSGRVRHRGGSSRRQR